MKNKIVIITGILTAILALIMLLILPQYLAGEKKNAEKSGNIFIYPNTPLDTVKARIYSYLIDPKSFNKVLNKELKGKSIKPGMYKIKQGATNKELARMLANGWQSPYKLILSGNLRGLEKLSATLGNKMMADSTAFIEYFNSPTTWVKYNTDSANFQSIFLPNTYEVYWTESPEQLTNRLKKEYDKFWNEDRTEKAKQIGLTPAQVSILASIVCEESNYSPELTTIAGVYMNRLNRGMKLDADPTVKFAIGDPTIKRILYKHLEIDSPYNTYKNIGLPPSPITIPSIEGIEAVLNYKKHNYLYFCADASLNGTHNFAKTLSEHNRNARAYQAAIAR